MSHKIFGVIIMTSSLVWFLLGAYVAFDTYVMYQEYKVEMEDK